MWCQMMKASEIWSNLTPGERVSYIAQRKGQGRRIGESMLPLAPLGVLFGFLGRFDLYSVMLYLLLSALSVSKLPKLIGEIRRENKEWLAKTAYARSRGLSSNEIQL